MTTAALAIREVEEMILDMENLSRLATHVEITGVIRDLIGMLNRLRATHADAEPAT